MKKLRIEVCHFVTLFFNSFKGKYLCFCNVYTLQALLKYFYFRIRKCSFTAFFQPNFIVLKKCQNILVHILILFKCFQGVKEKSAILIPTSNNLKPHAFLSCIIT